MENKFLKITDRNEWQSLLNKVLFKTLFHNIEWEEFLEQSFKWLRFERYLYKDLALLSLARVGDKLISHPFCEYGGPLPLVEKIDGEKFKQDLFSEFSAFAKASADKKNQIKISFHPHLLNYFHNETRSDRVSFERETLFFENLGQKSVNEIWQSLDRNRRRSIKLALAQNLKVQKCENLKELKDFYHFYVKNLKRHKALPYPFSFFEFFFNNPQAKTLLVKKEKKIVGGNLFLLYNKIVHSFLCGFEEKYRKLGAHSSILWEMIKKAKKEGYETFDFGAVRKDSSIRDFKERWGAKSYLIFELKNYSGESGLRKSKLRIIYGSLPLFLIKKLSPHLLKYKY